MITKHTEFPDLKWWQRWIRKLAGGQDWKISKDSPAPLLIGPLR